MGVISESDTYVQLLLDILPLAFLGGVVAMILNLRRIVGMHKGVRLLVACIECCLVGSLAAALSVLGSGLLVPLVTPETQLVIATVGGAMGQKTLDVFGQRIFGRYYLGSIRGKDDIDWPPRRRSTDTPATHNGEA